MVATPVAGQVKGTDGPDWVLACVLLRVDATSPAPPPSPTGTANDCSGPTSRWQIAPGAQPAPAPSTWPGTDLARRAGWLHLVTGGAGMNAIAVNAMAPLDGWDDLLNPFTDLGNAAGKVVADAWTTAMLAFWNAGLWLLQLVLGLTDTFLTPDLRESGPMGSTSTG